MGVQHPSVVTPTVRVLRLSEDSVVVAAFPLSTVAGESASAQLAVAVVEAVDVELFHSPVSVPEGFEVYLRFRLPTSNLLVSRFCSR